MQLLIIQNIPTDVASASGHTSSWLTCSSFVCETGKKVHNRLHDLPWLAVDLQNILYQNCSGAEAGSCCRRDMESAISVTARADSSAPLLPSDRRK